MTEATITVEGSVGQGSVGHHKFNIPPEDSSNDRAVIDETKHTSATWNTQFGRVEACHNPVANGDVHIIFDGEDHVVPMGDEVPFISKKGLTINTRHKKFPIEPEPKP